MSIVAGREAYTYPQGIWHRTELYDGDRLHCMLLSLTAILAEVYRETWLNGTFIEDHERLVNHILY